MVSPDGRNPADPSNSFGVHHLASTPKSSPRISSPRLSFVRQGQKERTTAAAQSRRYATRVLSGGRLRLARVRSALAVGGDLVSGGSKRPGEGPVPWGSAADLRGQSRQGRHFLA